MARRRYTRKASSETAAPKACHLVNDFYGHLNDAWKRSTELPPTETRITQSFFIQQVVNKELDSVIATQPPDSAIGLFLRSWDTARLPAALLHPALTLSSVSDICRLLGWLNRVGIAGPLWLYKQGDPQNHRKCRLWIEEGNSRIGIPEYWLWPEYSKHRAAYASYIDRLADLTGLPILKKAYEAEREFAEVYPSVGQRQKGNTVLTYGELKTAFRTMDWNAFLVGAGYTDDAIAAATYRITSRPFLHHLQARLESWSLDRWRGWLACILTQWAAGMAPPGPLRAAWFAYNRVFLQGMKSDQSTPSLRSAIVRTVMPNMLGQLWVNRFCDGRTRRRVAAMCERIRAAADSAIAATPWMAASTRAAAREKLRRLRIEVGWPSDPWVSRETVCGLSPSDYYGNLLELGKLTADINMSLRADCRRPLGGNWSRPVYEVNAFYYPDENRFLLPAAILRPPYWNPDASVPANYGGIGATIGHEISHAFDSEGRHYDARGDKRDWWTPRDDREYRRRAAAIVRLYETRPYRGMNVNGTRTLLENIADIAGVQFALAGMAAELGRTATAAELREFFEAFAISWRAKDRLRRAAQLLETDLHAPPMMRVNHLVRLFDEWYEAFGISPDCEDYIPPRERVQFFGAA